MRAKNRVRVTSHSLTGFDVFLSVGTLKNRSFTAFGVSRSEIGIAGRNVSLTIKCKCPVLYVDSTPQGLGSRYILSQNKQVML